MSATERRRAAVLVTVVSDYASLVDRMTPIEAHRLVALLRDTAVDVVRAYGGLVNQAIGEEIVSLFGVPIAHDDDDLRAVRAALELHARVRRAGGGRGRTGRQAERPVGAARRAGRRPTSARRTATLRHRRRASDAWRRGWRRSPIPDMCWSAPRRSASSDPYMHTAPCSPVVLDSQAGPVTPFRVLGETGIATRLEASSRTGLTPYVGRQSELSMLQSHVTRAGSGLGGVIAVVGEPGAGKSRLLYELQERLGSPMRTCACCTPGAARTATAFPTASSCRFCAQRSISDHRSGTPMRSSRGFARSTLRSSRSCRSSCTCCR